VTEIPPPPLEASTGDNPGASVIWLHGLGADGYDFLPIVEELDLGGLGDLRFVFPHAPLMPVTLNNGYVMPAWYDVVAIHADAPEDEAGIRASAQTVTDLIARENARGIPARRIVLAGFSQGGVIALHTALRHPQRLAGALILSSYLALAERLPAEAAAANRDLPIFMAHGSMDNIVPETLARKSETLLRELDYPVEWHDYAMAHSVCPEEIADIGNWLRRVLAG
jgi:phospholipase/carboxylesterase